MDDLPELGTPVSNDDISREADVPREAAQALETGEPRVDEVLRGLDQLGGRPTVEHVAVFDQVHRGLQDALANLDSHQ